MSSDYHFEQLGTDLSICVSPIHKFGTDAFLLSDFAAVRHKDTVCDLGTGCGIIALLLYKNAKPRHCHAVDIQVQAIDQLKQTLSHNQIDAITPVLGDLKSLDLPKGSFDVVTCNPPYKADGAGILSELTAEKIARHEVLCTIEDVCNTASSLLKFGGRVCICQRPERLCDVLCAMRAAKLEPKKIRFIAKHANEAPWLFLVEGKKGSKPFLQTLPTLAVYTDDDTEFSPEMQVIYHWDQPYTQKEGQDG